MAQRWPERRGQVRHEWHAIQGCLNRPITKSATTRRSRRCPSCAATTPSILCALGVVPATAPIDATMEATLVDVRDNWQ
jgi:hypothetical protein